MILSIDLLNFRNYDQLRLNISSPLNLFVGKNGQGKTNLLEAIYFFSRFNSFRTSDVSQMIYSQKKGFQISVMTEFKNNRSRTDIQYSVANKKKIEKNGKKLTSQKLHFKENFTLLFSYRDLDLGTGSSTGRRYFFDYYLSLISKSYKNSFKEYRKLLAQRNAALKENNSKNVILWDEPLAKKGLTLIKARQNFISSINQKFQKNFNLLLGETFESSLQYRIKSPNNHYQQEIDLAEYLQSLKEAMGKDIASGQSSFGPHRDDFFFSFDYHSLKERASQGQMKLYIFAIKLTMAQYWTFRIGTPPTLLLDDILADLDEKRVDILFQFLRQSHQLFITCAHNELIKNWINDFSTFDINSGRIEKLNRGSF